MSKGKLWGIILLILFVLGFGIWLYTSSDVKKDVDPVSYTHLVISCSESQVSL